MGNRFREAKEEETCVILGDRRAQRLGVIEKMMSQGNEGIAGEMSIARVC